MYVNIFKHTYISEIEILISVIYVCVANHAQQWYLCIVNLLRIQGVVKLNKVNIKKQGTTMVY